MRALIDTNAYTAFRRDHEDITAILERLDSIDLPFIAVAELLAGFHAGTQLERNRAELDAFIERPDVSVIYADAGTLEAYAEVMTALRRLGKPIPTNDVWIAALARQHGSAIVSFDGHFDHVPALRVIRGLEDLIR